MSTPRLVIPLPSAELPTCKPNLMPFHIAYTGPAPVSAFMRIEKLEPAKITEEKIEDTAVTPGKEEGNGDMESDAKGPTPTDVSVDVEMKDASTTTPITPVEKHSLSAASSEATLVESQASTTKTELASPPPPPVLEDADRRFVSTFRGRTIHGLTVDLPDGYGGLLLQGDPNDKSKNASEMETNEKQASKSKAKASGKVKQEEKASSKPRGRLTRSAVTPKSAKPIVVDDIEDGDMADATTADEGGDVPTDETDAPEMPDDHLIRQLLPKAQFSSFTLWHADRPVDKGRDEYYRTLTEWVSLAHEINRTDL